MPAEAGRTVELSEPGEGLFGVINLRASDAGKTYEYTITESGDFGKGWSKTADVTATVKVTDDGEGKLSAEVTYTNNDTVTNSYSASGTTQLKITKALATGSTWPSGKKATFTLSAKTTGAPMPAEAGRTVELSEPGEGLFGVINLSTADAGKTYEYTITESGDFGKGWSKTADVTATVTVTDDGEGKLSADVEYTNADTVTNSYSASGIGEIKVKKNLVGRDWTDDDSFAFTLSPVRAVIDGEAIDVSSIPMPDVKSVTIKKTDENQTKTFGNITFTKAGTYIYKVTETTKDGDGITCSEREKTITINAVDDGEGSIVPAEGSQMIQTAEITNTYAAQGIGEIFVKKVLEGRKWKSSDEFTFTISADEGTPMPENDSITIKKSDWGQTKSFGEIEFTEEGTYTYTVKETRGSISGVTYDESEHTVTIEAVDDGQGHIVPAEGSQLIQTEEFTNTYEAGATFGEILVQKVLNGREWKDSDEFEFTLSASGDAPMPENDTIVITKDDEDHIAGFGQIEFTEPGKYTYIVKETRGDEKGMTYDSKEHKVTLEVVDDGNGKLVAKSGTKLIQTVKITNTFSKGVKTGDSSNIVLYSVTSLSALILLLITYIIRRRENNRA
jgi:pilin isopeptide linkage protein